MLNFMNRMYVGMMIRFTNFVDSFKEDESGVAAIVATVLLILIVVLLAALFWDKIQEWFNDMWEKITNKANAIDG